MFELKGKVAIVTGSRRGIGQGIALAMAKAGADVVVSDVSQEDCEKVVKEIEALGRKAFAVKCDVSKKSEVEALVAATAEKFGHVDIMVNNAGICPFKPFLELDDETLSKTLDVNLKGVIYGAQAAAKQMVKQGNGGKIISITSIAGAIGYPTLIHYCASKGGIIAATRAMALELAQHKINVNAIGPGAIQTPMIDPLMKDPKVKQQTIQGIPLKRIGTPEDIAACAVYLASKESDYVTGATFFVDGGWISQ